MLKACEYEGSSLHPDLLFEILVRLPPDDLVRCLCVSKAWYAFIHDNRFIKTHLRRSIQTNSFRTLLIEDGDALSFVAAQEIQKKYKLNKSFQCTENNFDLISLPFNRDDTMEISEEEIVAGSVSECYQVSVYSLKSNSWKRIPTLPCSGSAFRLASSIVSLEDALAWLMHNKSDRNPFKILTLNLSSHKYEEWSACFDQSRTALQWLEFCKRFKQEKFQKH